MRSVLKARVSPAMVVACVAVILATTGSAFAAKALITGSDIKDGTISRADLSNATVRSLKGRRGPAGRKGKDGSAGSQGPQGSTGPAGPQGPAGPAGARGATGATGATGGFGPTGPSGLQGATGPAGPAGPPGQALVTNFYTGTTPTDVGAALALASTGPDNTEGVDLTAGQGGIRLDPGQYMVDVNVSFTDALADARVEYGVARLFLSGTPLVDPNSPSPTGGFADSDTTLVTADVPDSGNPAQASGTYLLTVTDDGVNSGEILTLRAAVRTDEPDGASATASVIVTRVG